MKKERKQHSNSKKLFAVVCMLLVSCMLVVTASYAWFTLSTAPEVKNISTAVGANGNLEIALLPTDGDLLKIGVRAGDSLEDMEKRNVTWGNLVDLSDSAIYGLDAMTLYPSQLNATYDDEGNLKSIGKLMLCTPSYSEGGRVGTLNPNTLTALYDSDRKIFMPGDVEQFGVRAIGTASGMSDRQLVYRNARSAASTAAATAKSAASQSLNNNGSALANVAIKKGTGSDSYSYEELLAMEAIVNDLLGTEEKTGALEYVEKAYMQYILAYAASAAINDGGLEDAAQAYRIVQSLVTAEGATLQSVLSGLSGITLPAQLQTAIDQLQATRAKVEEASVKAEQLLAANQETYTWAEVRDVLILLVDAENMEVNGIKAGEITQGDNMSKLVASVAGGLKVTMASQGGVYADIADHCGDFTVNVVLNGIKYNGLVIGNLPALMETKSSQQPSYLTNVDKLVEKAGAPASGVISGQPITNMYGYVIDLALRTNAAESNLLLQTEGVDRIYSDNNNPGTMGGGSNMTFNIVNDDLEQTQIRELLGAIRLVFFVPGEADNQVIVSGKLDGANATYEDGVGWTANLTLYKEKLVDGSITETPVEDQVIMPLQKNVASKLSVLVYMDGSLVGNEDVAASAATSMVGKLNLQFASSATLIPMDYAPLHTPGN